MKNYKAIIFDLGGVILNIDYLLTIKEFEKLGMNCYYLLDEEDITTIFPDIIL